MDVGGALFLFMTRILWGLWALGLQSMTHMQTTVGWLNSEVAVQNKYMQNTAARFNEACLPASSKGTSDSKTLNMHINKQL